ncbi:MAG: glycosyltransferase [Nocardioides sp.]|uniref:glycosyltransferase family 2 protein n=1 Tax=Nocardioides sp. TaxID=35761 RepID=UPI0039E4FC02
MSGESPLFSIVTPVYDPPVEFLRETVESVLAQTYDDWELILVDDCSPNPEVLATLRSYAAADPRIRLIERSENGHIVAASNDAVAASRGAFIVLLDHDDVLVHGALAANAKVIAAHDDVDYIYSDETLYDGGPVDPFVKPDWSPERLRAQNYCCHLSVLRADVVREVGAFRPGFDGSQDHDLVLRVTERARRIVHIPRVLYHWRIHEASAAGNAEAKPYALDAGRRAVQDHLDRVGIRGRAITEGPGRYRIERVLAPERTVSIVIPTRGSSAMVWGRRRVMVVDAVRSALEMAHHPTIEVVVVYDAETPTDVLDQLKAVAGDRLVLVRFAEPFNYSRKMNAGVLASSGERLVLLNDDVEFRSPGWTQELLAPLDEPDVGATGGKLYFEDSTIQHVGLAWVNGQWEHPYRLHAASTPGHRFMNLINREVSGVTGACTGIRRETYFEIGGLSEQLPGNFNDVDFCYKITSRGYRILYVAHCELFHFESKTREAKVLPWEVRLVRQRWGVPGRDPYSPDYPDMPPSPRELRRRREASRGGTGEFVR